MGSGYLCVSVDEPMLSGLRMVLLRALWICVKLGLSVLSFCQQSNINWCRDAGQFRGAGKRNPSSIALITYNIHEKHEQMHHDEESNLSESALFKVLFKVLFVPQHYTENKFSY